MRIFGLVDISMCNRQLPDEVSGDQSDLAPQIEPQGSYSALIGKIEGLLADFDAASLQRVKVAANNEPAATEDQQLLLL